MLIASCCQLDLAGNYIARELEQNQTLDNLWAFGRRLAVRHAKMKENMAKKIK